MPEANDILHQALQLHQAGNLPAAGALYRQIVANNPGQADALHLLGVIAAQSGQADEAVRLITQAIAIKPDFPIALANLGKAQRDKGDLDAAIASYRQAIALNPDDALTRYHLARIWMDKGQFDQAIAGFQEALALRPDVAEARVGLANALMGKGRFDEAIASYQRALALNPNHAEAQSNLGVAWDAKGQIDQAIACYQRAVAINPDYPEAHNNLGNAWNAKAQPDKAIACFRRAIELNPRYVEAHNNLGAALADLGRSDEAITCYRTALSIRPNFAGAHNNLAQSLLRSGQFAEGWKHFEWRYGRLGFPGRRDLGQPIWNGANLPGCTILLTAEQGMGDTIQFIRYAALVAGRCQRVLLECPSELLPLLREVRGITELVRQNDPLAPFDAHCPLLSLPGIFSTTLDSIPRDMPYLRADPARAAAWSARFGPDRRLKIGLAWAGNPRHKNDRNRSIPPAAFAPLSAIPGTVFVSLQKSVSASQPPRPPAGMEMIDHTTELRDFADTAALIANLDLVISVDTAIVHLAGAMAKPVWTLLPQVADWRWLMDRSDSPWYPTMRLFRQPGAGDWAAVMQRVAAELAGLPR